ncbi:hypothetical protein I4U23_031303 [Adineta vaga]|nr:hypothetical protein I4U23_031303 [Adineta vaga]
MTSISQCAAYIYYARGRIEFLQLVKEVHGEKMSRFLGEIDIDSAHCLISVDIIAVIEKDKKLLSIESQKYLFDEETKKIRSAFQVNIERFIKQMKSIALNREHQLSIGNENTFSSSSDINENPTKKKRSYHGEQSIKHQSKSKRKDESFSSGPYDSWSSLEINQLNSEERLEYNIATATRIEHFLKEYCSVRPIDITNTKIRLLYDLKVHEEQLYEILTYIRNVFGDSIQENIDKDQLSASISKMLGGFKPLGHCRT